MAYPKGHTNFAPILRQVRETKADVLAVATYFEDAAAIARQLRELNVNPKMWRTTFTK